MTYKEEGREGGREGGRKDEGKEAWSMHVEKEEGRRRKKVGGIQRDPESEKSHMNTRMSVHST